MLYLFLLLVLSPLLVLGLFRLYFGAQRPEKLMNKYSGQEVSVLQKKYPEADVQGFRSIFLKIGLVFTLLLSLYAFNFAYRPSDGGKQFSGNLVVDDNIEVLPPVTKTPPPAVAPPPPPKVEIVDDEEILETEPDLNNTEADENTVIEPAEPVAEQSQQVVSDKLLTEPKKIAEEPEEPEIFLIVQEMPEYPGGQTELFKYLATNTHYPPMARENGIEGSVYVGFVVMEDGSISNVQIKRGLPGGGAGCDEEAVRVVKQMPKWKPGKQRGKNVRVAYTLPFKFKLD
ncbi:energy transducer TonB [Sphingobacteriales bacterium UPWRP_1]|nr:hypothetical protein B6N25_17355 [Sphingobacteriales bacterium TSM_CSS]PSJ73039.1 energy transducer TonB [Sphingobacteriales bacterium UPWRP_1]